MVKRINPKDKKIPGPNFLINIPITMSYPIHFSFSTDKEIYKNFKKVVKKNKEKMSDVLRRYIYEIMDISTMEELANEVPQLENSVIQIKEEIKKIVTGNNGKKNFSLAVEKMMESYVDENKSGDKSED